MSKARNCLVLAAFVIFMSRCCRANDIYIAQNAVGGNTGVDCAHAHGVSWFNTSSNWGPSGGQIGPGTTVHLCGNFTDNTPGDTLLNVQGSGTSGSPITLLFDTGATLTNTAYWGTAAIVVNNQNYIVINGGTNGLIQNTGNGSGLAYQQSSGAVSVSNGSNVTVENLTSANIYQHTSSSDLVGGASAISTVGATNVTIRNNIVHDAQNCIYAQPVTGVNGLLITGNTSYNCNWGVGVGNAASSGIATGITISNNTIHDAANWDSSTGAFHHNGIMVYDTNGTGGFSGVVEEGNYIYGNFGANNTAWIFNDDNTGQMSNFLIYNNVLVNGNSVSGSNEPYIYGVPTGSQIYNNTIWGNGLSVGIGTGVSASSGTTFENNLIANVTAFIEVTSAKLIDYNQYMSFAASGCETFLYGGGPCSGQSTFAAWKAACSCDAHGAYNAADTVNSNGTLQAGSPAIRAGTNLTSLGIVGLNIDKVGTPRPSTGNWDIGAYQSGGPPPPVELNGSVK